MIIISKKDDKPYYDFDHYAIGFGAWLDDAVKQFENSVEGSLSVKYSKGREYYYQRIRSKDGKLIFKRLHLDNEEEALLGLKLFEKAKYRKKDLEQIRYDARLAGRVAKIRIPAVVREDDFVCGYPLLGDISPRPAKLKGIFSDMLYEELGRFIEKFKLFKEVYMSLPQGSLVNKNIKGKQYPYIVYEDHNKKRIYRRSFIYQGKEYSLNVPEFVDLFKDLKSRRDEREVNCRRLLKDIFKFRRAIDICINN